VHGAIDLEPVELEIIDTPTFQRLRRIRQLAMVSQVYPGADHSRFLHSLGVFSIMSRILQRLREVAPHSIPEEDVPKLRLAALLHDVGQYPYSHLMERAPLPPREIQLGAQAVEQKSAVASAEQTPGQFPDHEELGQYILSNRIDVQSVLSAYGYDAEEIGSIFRGRHNKVLYNQICTSALDVDRMDYMLRDAHYSGVPYGQIDLDYIVHNLELDDNERLCVNAKAVPSVEHFLLSRWYNYGQVVHQKAVMGMEHLGSTLLSRLIERHLLPWTRERVFEIVVSEAKFLGFDDSYVDRRVQRLSDAAALDKPEQLMAYAIRNRVKPRCVYEGSADVRSGEAHRLRLFKSQIPGKVPSWAKRFSIPEGFWMLADSKPRTLEELKPYGGLTDEEADQEDGAEGRRAERRKKLVRVKERTGISTCLMDKKESLLEPLKNATFRVVRVYVLMPDEIKDVRRKHDRPGWRLKYKEEAERIRDHIGDDLGIR
jgi:hypothetical protein